MRGTTDALRVPDDIIIVTPALTRFLGGATNAIVWSLINHRSAEAGGWHRATMDDLSDSTGLTRSAVRTALAHLVGGGFLECAAHHVGGFYDQTRSYRPVVAA
ncbi:MAG: hypothetical protein NVSMB4_18050 [Acidimicrobiales bacterium]